MVNKMACEKLSEKVSEKRGGKLCDRLLAIANALREEGLPPCEWCVACLEDAIADLEAIVIQARHQCYWKC